jgi:hypothetical protein
MNNSYYLKYIKYKNKYLKLQKGGDGKPLPKLDNEILEFIKEITMENIRIRFESSSEYPEHIIETIKTFVSESSSKEDFKKQEIQPFVFSKGINKMYGLMDLLSTFSNKSYTAKFKVFIVAQFIIINQVFSDGNHRTAMYVLAKYGGFNEGEIKQIMDFTERIHKWDGDLKDLGMWKLESDKLLKPQIDKISSSSYYYLFK